MIYALENRVGIDSFIYRIQEKFEENFDNLDIYGRATINRYENTENVVQEVPQVFVDGENRDVFFSENDKMFFMTGDTYSAEGNTNYRVDLYVYFCFNLEKASLNDNEIRMKCRRILDKAGICRPNLEVGFKKVFDGITWQGKEKLDFYPYHWFRFNASETFKYKMT